MNPLARDLIAAIEAARSSGNPTLRRACLAEALAEARGRLADPTHRSEHTTELSEAVAQGTAQLEISARKCVGIEPTHSD